MTVVGLIDRYYEREPPPWGGRVRSDDDPAEWGAHVEHEIGESGERPFEERWFDDVDVAIDWVRRRSEIVLVRLGHSDLEVYSAGSVRANERVDGSASDYPEWPPDNWPAYRGPTAERRRFISSDVTEPVENPSEEWTPEPRFAYRFTSLESDDEPGHDWRGWVTTRAEVSAGDRIRFPTFGRDTWVVVEVTQPGTGGRDPSGVKTGLDLGAAGLIRSRALDPPG